MQAVQVQILVAENDVVLEKNLTVEGATTLKNTTAQDVTVDDLIINENVTINGPNKFRRY